MGSVVIIAVGGMGVVTSVTSGGLFCVHPARKTAVMQMRIMRSVFLSIIKNQF
jgi:hypothetical protein